MVGATDKIKVILIIMLNYLVEKIGKNIWRILREMKNLNNNIKIYNHFHR